MMKASKMALGLFSSGFLLFSLYKYFSQKRITKEQISKIIKKISNLSIHFIFQKYDSQNKILNQKIENEEKNISNVLIKEQNNINNKSTFNKTEESFDNEILFVLLQIENEKIKSLGISNEEFQEYLLEYKDEDNEITKNLNLIQKVLNSFKQRKLPIINFGFIIPDKFIQIISNIYYFNLKASYLIFINKINSLKNNNDIFLSLGYKEKNEIFNNIYNINLKETRKKICEFFGIDKDNNLEINAKLALRIFPFYFDKNHNLRKKYQDIIDNVNKLISIIVKSDDKIDVLINENNKDYIKEPIDIIINFENILNEINLGLKNDILNKEDEIPYEDQWD